MSGWGRLRRWRACPGASVPPPTPHPTHPTSTEPFLRVGAATRILVPAGSLGKLTIDGASQLLEPGIHTFKEQSLRYDGSVDATSPLIVFGNIKRMLVRQGTWGVTYDDGALLVLQPGLHTLTKASHAVAGDLTAGMEVLALRDVRSMTADNVQVRAVAERECCPLALGISPSNHPHPYSNLFPRSSSSTRRCPSA